MNYHDAMMLALKLAKNGKGFVSPNPLVGAVIIKDNKIISTGYHHKYGDIHAEIDAINTAGNIDFSDAVLAVNLEPCSHQGKQPPCVDTIIACGFKKVIVGMTDPNPLVAGKGIQRLKDAGIEVVDSIQQQQCKWLNRAFIKHITTAMPYIVAKTAQSLNGAMATSNGDSKWISSEVSRTKVHKLRAEFDAVLVGRQTALIDNPSLTVRHVAGRNPRRIVLDTKLTLPSDLNLFTDKEKSKTILICSSEYKGTPKASSLLNQGIQLMFTETDNNGMIDLTESIHRLGSEFNIASILVEGGPTVLNNLQSLDLIDEFHLFFAPFIIPGGKVSFNGPFSINSIADAKKLEIIRYWKSGDDICVVAVKSS